MRRVHPMVLAGAALLWGAVVGASEYPATGTDLEVDTGRRSLTVRRGSEILAQFEGVSIGRGGASNVRFRGDSRTPRGHFRVGWINPNSRFTVFYGLTYPNIDHALAALERGRITPYDVRRVLTALLNDETPPQDTPLGGQIGIHGVGNAHGPHEGYADWTEGCVALSDDQIRRLARWVGVGTRVEVK